MTYAKVGKFAKRSGMEKDKYKTANVSESAEFTGSVAPSSDCRFLRAGWCAERVKNCDAALLQDDGSVACEMAL